MKKLLILLALFALLFAGGCALLMHHSMQQEIDGWRCGGGTYAVILPAGMPAEWVKGQADIVYWASYPYIVAALFDVDQENMIGVFIEQATPACPGWVGIVWVMAEMPVLEGSEPVFTSRCWIYDAGGMPQEATVDEFDAYILAWQAPEQAVEI